MAKKKLSVDERTFLLKSVRYGTHRIYKNGNWITPWVNIKHSEAEQELYGDLLSNTIGFDIKVKEVKTPSGGTYEEYHRTIRGKNAIYLIAQLCKAVQSMIDEGVSKRDEKDGNDFLERFSPWVRLEELADISVRDDPDIIGERLKLKDAINEIEKNHRKKGGKEAWGVN